MDINERTEGSYTHFTAREGEFGPYEDELYLGCATPVPGQDGKLEELCMVMFSEIMILGEEFQYLPGFITEQRAVPRLFERAAEWYEWACRPRPVGM